MAVIVTGGAGFIGSMVCKLLVEKGEDVIVIDNLRNGRKELVTGLGPQAKLFEIDIRNVDALRKIVQDIRPRSVCHLAALHFIPICNKFPLLAMDINAQGTLSVLEACKVAPPDMVVIASTAAVYGIGDDPCRETDQPRPLDIYGISKQTCEQLAWLYTADTGAPSIAARLFNAVGPNETNPHLIPQLMNQLIRGERVVSLGNLDPRRDYIHTSDLARGLWCAMNHKQEGHDVFNLGTGLEYSVKDIVAMCERILQDSITVNQNPRLTRKVDRLHLCANNEKARRILGWMPTVGIQAALKDILDSKVLLPIEDI